MPTVDLTGSRLKHRVGQRQLQEVAAGYDHAMAKLLHLEARDDETRGVREWWASCMVDDLVPMSLLLGDAIHNFRSALDHLFFQLVITNGRTPDRKTSFPILKDRDSYEQRRKRFATSVGLRAASLLDGVEPYRGGNDLLWKLHQLDITDKHKLLVPVGAAMGATVTTSRMADFTKPTADAAFSCGVMRAYIPSEPVEIKDTPTRLSEISLDDPKLDARRPHIVLEIHEPGVVEHEPLQPLLECFDDVVGQIIEKFA